MIKNTNNYCVYIHRIPKELSGNKHDKRYIGITCKKDPEKRWEHGFGYRYNKYFFRAIQKYGWDNIEHNIVAVQLTKDDACDMERLLIAMYKTTNRFYGFNLTFGGDGANGHKMSEAEKHRRSVRFKGNKNPFYNKKHSAETRKKMSENHWDCSGIHNHWSKAVYQFDLDGNFLNYYVCITDAVKDNNTTDMCVIKAIREKREGVGFFWGHKEDVIKSNKKYKLKKFKEYRRQRHSKTIEQYDLDGNYIGTFTNITKKAQEFNGTRQNIVRAIKMNTTAFGYRWKYAEV